MRVKCDSCEIMVINNHVCHEQGCPRIGKDCPMSDFMEPQIRLDNWIEVADNAPVDCSVIEMGLCEVEHVMLRPNQLYRFVVMSDCDKCKALNVYTQNVCETYYVPEDFADTAELAIGTLHKQKYGARLSAPGYMDCTEWAIFDTWEEARDYLVETYYDDPECEIPSELLEQ